MSAFYQAYLEPVIEYFTTGPYYREVYQAKQEYFEKTGLIYEEDEEFEHRMSLFLDWYLFDRDLPGIDLPPMNYYFKQNQERWNPQELEIYKNLCQTLHSIFSLSRLPWFGSGIVVYDLFSQKSYRVKDPNIQKGFSPGDLFEARLLLFQKHYQFSKGFCFHPLEVKPFILKEIKKVRYQDKQRKTKLILQLSGMKLKHLRFPHLDIHDLYQFESRISLTGAF